MDNKIINSSEYFILDLPVMLYRNIGCPKKNVWSFEIKCFKIEDKIIQEIKITNFHVHTVHLDNYQCFLPTDAQLDSLTNNFKFALKLTLKGFYMFRCEKHHPQGADYLRLAKVTIVKMS